jgi:uncharacterized protein (DUF433 family)
MSEDRLVAPGVNVNPDRMDGEPCIIGTRIPTYTIKSCAAGGWSVDKIISEYPSLNALQIADALAFEAMPFSVKCRVAAAE